LPFSQILPGAASASPCAATSRVSPPASGPRGQVFFFFFSYAPQTCCCLPPPAVRVRSFWSALSSSPTRRPAVSSFSLLRVMSFRSICIECRSSLPEDFYLSFFLYPPCFCWEICDFFFPQFWISPFFFFLVPEVGFLPIALFV